VFFSVYQLPENVAVYYDLPLNYTDERGHKWNKGELGPLDAAYAILVWTGMVMFGLFGAVGLIMLPYDFLAEFIYRPKPISAQEFARRKKILVPMLTKLRTKGKWIED
jgi:hypothetical protein